MVGGSLSLLFLSVPASAQSATDRAEVERAAVGCIEGFHEGDTTKLFRSVSPQVLKFGFYQERDGSWQRSDMPWPAFAEFAAGVRAIGQAGDDEASTGYWWTRLREPPRQTLGGSAA